MAKISSTGNAVKTWRDRRLWSLEEMIEVVFFEPDDFFVQPFFISTCEDNQTIFFDGHDLLCLYAQLAKIDIGQDPFEDGILDPVEVTATQFEHFADALLANVVNQDDVHVVWNCGWAGVEITTRF